MPELELGDGLLNSLGTSPNTIFDDSIPTQKEEEEEEEILKDIFDQYNIEGIKNTMDEKGKNPESIYFFYSGESEQFVQALEFIGLSPINSPIKWWSSICTKKISYRNSFEAYISSFLQSFSIDDQEKFDYLAFKNSKYLFYRFNDFIKSYGNPRYKLIHTRKMLDTVGLQNVDEKNKQFLIEKIIHGIEFKNLYKTNSENKPEILSTIERRVYQQLVDINEYINELEEYINELEEYINNFIMILLNFCRFY